MTKNRILESLKIFLFIPWPFGAFLMSLKNIEKASSAIVFILFCMIFGYSFNFQYESADSFRVALTFSNAEIYSFSDLYDLYAEGGAPDIYKPLAFGFVKIFTDNPKFLFGFFGLVFGVFWYLSIVQFSKGKKGLRGYHVILLFIVFLSINPIVYINGPRFNTAIWVFFFSIVNLFFYRKKIWIFGILITPLFHFSFLFFSIPVLFYFLFENIFHNREKVYNWLVLAFIVSFIFSWVLKSNAISLGFITSNIELSSGIQSKVDSYNSDEMSDLYAQRTSGSIFLQVTDYIVVVQKIYFFFLIFFLIKKIKKINDKARKLFLVKMLSLVLFLFTVSFVATLVPSGGRFLSICYLLTLLLLVNICKSQESKQVKVLIWVLFFVFLFNILFGLFFLSINLVGFDPWFNNTLSIISAGYDFRM